MSALAASMESRNPLMSGIATYSNCISMAVHIFLTNTLSCAHSNSKEGSTSTYRRTYLNTWHGRSLISRASRSPWLLSWNLQQVQGPKLTRLTPGWSLWRDSCRVGPADKGEQQPQGEPPEVRVVMGVQRRLLQPQYVVICLFVYICFVRSLSRF